MLVGGLREICDGMRCLRAFKQYLSEQGKKAAKVNTISQ